MERTVFRFPSSTSTTPLVPRISYDGGIEMRDYLGSQDPGSPHTPQSAPSRGQRLITIARKILTGPRELLDIVGHQYRKQVRRTFGDLESWRIGVLTGCFASGLVFLINLILFLVAATRYEGFQDGIATLARGERGSIAAISTTLHLLINILSTVLLSSSSYTMQILSSPTRPEVDAAHDRGQWLDIGLLSTRNLKHINRKRLTLWFILAASSIPLHLFYNAAVFKYTVAYEYDATFVNYMSGDYLRLNTSREVSNLTNAQWMKAFSSELVYDYTDLHIVFDAIGTATAAELTNPITISLNTSWPQRSSTYSTDPKTQEWLETSEGYYVRAVHAFAHPAGGQGQNAVQLSLHFMLIVIVANLVKAVVMGSVALKAGLVDGSSYLVTCGDAVASFLARPDPNTKGLSTASKSIMLGIADRDRSNDDRPQTISGGNPVVEGYAWKPQQHGMGSAMTSPRMLWWCNTMLVASSFGGALLIGYSDSTADDSFAAWGTSSQKTLVKSGFSTASILLNAWLTNIPQLLFSFTYFNLNGIFTSMALAKEWNDMASQRKGLRVSHPEQAQRSTYFLQLPYKWAIPLTIGSGSLHWLISQTIFLVQIDVQASNGQPDADKTFVASGFSSLSCLVLIVVFGAILIVAYLVAALPLRENIPFGASCSAIISAACHPPDTDAEAYLKEVQWGVTDTTHISGVQHCSFTSQSVSNPIPGNRYA
ncbi:hypothetical protein KCU98_g4806, partial [Aureobasidium melanogenum]